ncbi:MAG: hypothetical protein E6H40_12740 [Betaproteobacteria bacterium]|nr:MAG: hypothetical protein E6H40_12740 [Betaproteobacteria bacterium]
MSKSACVPSRRILTLLTFVTGFALPLAAAAETRVSQSYGKLPLHFEANQGQTHQDVRFLARGSGYSLYLTAGEAVLVLTKPNPDATQARGTPVVVRMSVVGAAPKPLVSGLDELPGKANYLIGNPAKWRTNVPTYAKVHYRAVYPGIDLVYYGNQRQLEYDFVVSPGADPEKIVLGFQGAERLEINAEGELVLHAAGEVIRQRVPVIYQEINGVRTKIEGRYVLKDAHRVGFQVAAYDPSRPLVIDPTLVYATYLGSSGWDYGSGIAVDAAGSAYVTGSTSSADFPTANALQAAKAGFQNAFVTKLNPTGSALVYSTYLGGSGGDGGTGIAVDAAGSAYVTGSTSSIDFPTVNPLQAAYGGDGDAFVSKLDAAGSALLYSTYLGGSGADAGYGIAVDTLGNAYVTGETRSTDFPTTPGAIQTTYGGSCMNCVGDAFVTKLDATGSALVYSTYLGGSSGDEGFGIAVDAAGSAYVTGGTGSADFPTTAGAFQTTYGGGDAFVTKLNATGTALVYSTYLGGSGNDYGSGIAVDAAGSAYVSGSTSSTDFPTANPSQAAYGGGVAEGGGTTGADAFVSKLDATGSALLYSTYLGGSSNEYGRGIAVDAAGAAYVTGFTKSTDFTAGCTAPCTVLDGTFSGRSTPFGVPYDAFVAKIADMSSTPGTVSLWGFIDSAGNITVPLLGIGPVPGANFDGTVQFNSGDPSPTGDVRYIDLVTGADIAATSFTTLVIGAGPCGADTHALIIGKATVNGVPDQDFQVDVDDCSPDTLTIMSGPTQVYANGGPLVVGNIQVEKAQ